MINTSYPQHQHILIEPHPECASMVVRLNRPDKRNALTAEMYGVLCQTLHSASNDNTIKSVIIVGGDHFTAGNDIGEFLNMGLDGSLVSPDAPVMKFLRAISQFEKPIIAAFGGQAIGIGTTVLLHCDIVIAALDAYLQMPFTKLGLVPEAASSLLVPRLAGQARAAKWLMLGLPFTAIEAQAAGIVTDVLPKTDIEAAALSYAQQFAALPPEAVRYSKQLLKRELAGAVAETIAYEGSLFGKQLQTAECKEALTAFQERRAPRFH